MKDLTNSILVILSILFLFFGFFLYKVGNSFHEEKSTAIHVECSMKDVRTGECTQWEKVER